MAKLMRNKGSGATLSVPDIPAFRWWHGIIIGLLLAYTPGSLLVGGVLLLPLVFLRLIDPEADGQRVMVVMFYLGAAMVHPLRVAWSVRGDWATCLSEIMQPTILILDWLALGAAWLIAEVGSMGARVWYAESERQRRKAIEVRIKALQEEWIQPDSSED